MHWMKKIKVYIEEFEIIKFLKNIFKDFKSSIVNLKEYFCKYNKNREFNLMNNNDKIEIYKEEDDLISEDIYYKKLYRDIYQKYKVCNIALERAKINQYFMGNRKEQENSSFLIEISSSAIFGSLLGAFFSISINESTPFPSWGAFGLVILTIFVFIVLLNIVIRHLSRDTYCKDEYYNIVLEVLNVIEKERERINEDKSIVYYLE